MHAYKVLFLVTTKKKSDSIILGSI